MVFVLSARTPVRKNDCSKKVRVDWCKEMFENYDRGASKDGYKIVTGNESWIYAHEPETAEQSYMWIF